MKVRIRRMHGGRGATPSDVVLDVGVLRLGRGADLDVRGTLVPPEHSEIAPVDGAIRLRVAAGHSVEIDGESVGDAELRPGVTFAIGTTVIRVLPPEPGEDVLLEVTEAEERQVQAEATAAVRRRIRWSHRPRNRIWLAVLASLAVLALLWGMPARNAGRPSARAIMARYGVGHISPAHRHVADQCATCHDQAFQPVADRGCQTAGCHPTVGRHGGTGREAGDEIRCAACHPEHDGAERLVDRSDAGCAACHADLESRHPDWDVLNAAAFVDRHAEFRPSVVVAPEPIAVRRVSLAATDGLRERSGLAFSHAKHLVATLRAKAGDRRLGCAAGGPAEGKTLACADCHTLDAAGELMQPVSYRRHCQSCHDLTPSCAEPGYQIEHGSEPAKVARELEAFAAARHLDAGTVTPPPARHRPDAPPPRAEPVRAISPVADFLGEHGVCTLCHAAELSNGLVTRITPLRIVPTAGAPRWMPRARFSHRPHVGVPGAPACTDCHAAPTADTSEAVLMPGIARCRDCHGATTGVRLTAPAACTGCHVYHGNRHGVRAAGSAGQRADRS